MPPFTSSIRLRVPTSTASTCRDLVVNRTAGGLSHELLVEGAHEEDAIFGNVLCSGKVMLAMREVFARRVLVQRNLAERAVCDIGAMQPTRELRMNLSMASSWPK